MAGLEQVKKVRGWIDGHFSRLRVVETSYCDVPLEILLSVRRFDPARTDLDWQALEQAGYAGAIGRDERHNHDHGHDHSTTLSTWSYETTRPLSLEALREATKRLPANVYRCKGVVYTSDAPDQRVILQVVGKRVEISVAHHWGEQQPCTRLVAIGEHGAMNDDALREGFDRCLQPNSEI